MDEMIREITQRVISALASENRSLAAAEGKAHILVLGCREHPMLPELVGDGAAFGMDDYISNNNITRYQKVIVTEMTTAELADIAMGRDADDLSRAVLEALLSGIEVIIAGTAFPHRKFAGRGSTVLFNTLENYVKTLQIYGVRIADAEGMKKPLKEAAPPKWQAPESPAPWGNARPNAASLITEADAIRMVENGECHIPKDSILTPLARDIFQKNKWDIS